MAEELAAGFRRGSPGVVLLVDRFESPDAARAQLRSGRADVVISIGGDGDLLGWRPLCLAVDPGIALPGLAASDLARIYRQQATLWSQIGPYGERPITPVDRAAADADHLAFDRGLLGGPSSPVGNALVVADDAAAADSLSRPGTLAYLGLRSVRGAPVRLDGSECTPDSVRRGAWPLVEEVRVSASAASGSRYPSDFVRYARSAAGQAIVDRHEVSL